MALIQHDNKNQYVILLLHLFTYTLVYLLKSEGFEKLKKSHLKSGDTLTERLFPLTGRFTADNLNKVKNLCSKSIGEKMKVQKLQIFVSCGVESDSVVCPLAKPVYLPSLTPAVNAEEGTCRGG